MVKYVPLNPQHHVHPCGVAASDDERLIVHGDHSRGQPAIFKGQMGSSVRCIFPYSRQPRTVIQDLEFFNGRSSGFNVFGEYAERFLLVF